MQLASDLNNQQFSGAISNPDSLLHREFYMHKPLDKWATEVKSQEAGRLIRVYGPEQPFVRIMRPGDSTSVLEVPVREEHKQRWPEEWLYFQMNNGLIDEGKNIPGWQLAEWPHLIEDPEFLRNLKHMRFYTVEQVAGASDAQLQRIGSAGAGLRERARADLRKKLGNDMNEAISAKDKEIEILKKNQEIMMEQLAKLTEAVTAPPTAVEKKRG